MNPTCSSQIERNTCSRCGGTGHMPFSVYSGICFKCHGNTYVLTKRGLEANRYLAALRSKPVADLKVGDVIQVNHWSPTSSVYAFNAITKIALGTPENAITHQIIDGQRVPCGVGDYHVETTSDKHGILSQTIAAGSMVRVAQTAEQKAATLRQALAYQDTLTKSGTVRKSG